MSKIDNSTKNILIIFGVLSACGILGLMFTYDSEIKTAEAEYVKNFVTARRVSSHSKLSKRSKLLPNATEISQADEVYLDSMAQGVKKKTKKHHKTRNFKFSRKSKSQS